MTVNEIIAARKRARHNILIENYTNTNLFREKLINLIHSTPTGDLRNTYTELSILFESILNNNKDLTDL